MKVKHAFSAAMAVMLMAGCQNTSTTEKQHSTAASTAKVDAKRIKAHLRFLSDDLLEGRDTGSKGHQIASLYIATEFEKYGLEPAGDNGTYFQDVTFRKATLDQESPHFTLKDAKGERTFSYPSEFLMSASLVRETSAVNGELVFVGYGIVAPELNHDDYTDIDVEGKIVVLLSGKPKSFPSEEGAHFASTSLKHAYAAQRGAIGVIAISTPIAEKVAPYQNLLNYIHTPALSWVDKQGQPANTQPSLQARAYLSVPAAQRLFATADVSLDDIYAQLEEDKVPASFPMNVSVSLSQSSKHENIQSPNVAAVLLGSDATLKNEYVLYSAHSDHIGIAKTVKKDRINNGAMDNASGTAIMLETARMFANQRQRPKRSVLFVAVTGEEKGLLGSDYYAQNATVPIENIVANVNLDMPILTYEFADVIAFGANHSDMQASVAKAAKNVGISLSPDPWPEQALFTRSDHYSFVKQGVPAVFLVPGLQSADPDIDGSKQFGKFLSTHYHKPSDDFNQPFNWEAAIKFTEVNFQIGQTLADQAARPAWNEGDFFGITFGK
ncbi:M28 family metallopeptidase [Aestuariibacter sp. AA17]|uniref:M28 family metallopeptidase n=1 Tax=Fluctibacter corallii TaxID=2984329 RepID=A0ABT3ABT5_9ALTE|nr:M28 family metallopeptidase [Aestuariibacter sp. AA17]MCV2886148.1 M28 family metallopeptidase [Aestuariibacter sp. AA17]